MKTLVHSYNHCLAGLAAVLCTSANLALAQLSPVAVTGFNRDVVIENTSVGPPYTTATNFNAGETTCFYQAGLPNKGYGFPVTGLFTNLETSTSFQLQPYTGSNALVLSSDTGTSNAPLTLVSPGTYSRIAVLATSGNGSGGGNDATNVTLRFNDNSTFTVPYYAPDWFGKSNGVLYSIALAGFERINLTSGAVSGVTNGTVPNNPRLYQTTIDLETLLGASNKPLVSLTFDKPSTVRSTAIFAISGEPALPSVLATLTNTPATSIQTTAATLNGQVITNGGDAPTITIYYGPANGGTNTVAWSNNVVLGTQNGTFSQPVTGLNPGTTYYHAARGLNAAGTAWATPSGSFTTLLASAPTVTNLPVTGIQPNSATLTGAILNTGGQTPTVTLFYGPNNGGNNPSAWSNNVSIGSQSGAFAQGIVGLTTNTTYFFTARAVNSGGTTWATPAGSFTTPAASASTKVPVLTYHNDNARLGANTDESILTLANVNTNTFGKLFTHPVDGFVYAQPLVMTNVAIPGKGVHDVVYVATEHNTLYAFDANSSSGINSTSLWQVSFLNPGAGVTTVPASEVGTSDITPEVGITATPVIDPVASTIYVQVKTKEVVSSQNHYVHRLHALDLATGTPKFNSPVLIADTIYDGGNYTYVSGPAVAGTGNGSVSGTLSFNGLRQMCRPAIALQNGVIYLAFASHGDNGPYHGWLLSYNATNISQRISVYCSTPNGGLGGFWQGGGGPAFDATGNFYLMTGNGSFSATGATFNQLTDSFAMSAMKFASTNGGTNAITLVDYFTTFNQSSLSGVDADFGSGAPIVLPDSAGSVANPRLLIAAGKGGKIFVINRDNMGRFNATTDNVVQVVTNALAAGSQNGNYATPAYFNNILYLIGMNDTLRAFRMSNSVVLSPPTQGAHFFGTKASSSPCVSANGTNDAILWMIESEGQNPASPAILRAYNATNVAQQLYDSSQILARDNPGTSVKFTLPTIANGKVYVGAQYAFSVYGLDSFLAVPTIAPNGGTFTNSVSVSLASATPGVTIYYTLDASTPTTNSFLYTGPFVLTTSGVVKARAFKAGSQDSAVASATFINSSEVGSGTGLSGAYYSNQLKTLNDPATLVRTDSVVNFNWGNGSPDPSVSANSFTVRWTGSVQPQLTGTYTFYTTTDDGVRLWVNGQLLVDHWVDQGPTEWSGSIALNAQQRYNLVMEYYENGGGAEAYLSWSSPSVTKAIIPQSQLYPFTNPPPVVLLTAPVSNATYTATASVTVSADADAQFNTLTKVDFYANTTFIGTGTDLPYTITTTGLTAGNYTLTAVATDGSGLSSTSAPVNITVTAGSGSPYGLTSRAPAPAFFGMPATSGGTIPAQLSLTGVFSNTPAMTPFNALIPYDVNTPLWSDAALKTRWLAVPNNGAPYTTGEQITFAPTGEWSFPAGTVFVKHFDLVTNEVSGFTRRLETRLLVRDTLGAVYGVTYKWRANNTDADLLGGALDENIAITTASGIRTQVWHYPSPAQCLECHTPEASYVLGVKTRQLNGNHGYPGGATDNQVRTLNRLGLLNPAINETNITGYAKLVALTNLSASLENRSRSYLDANCAHCHRPNGSGPTFDARYDILLASQHIINEPATQGDLGYDNAQVVKPKDIWRSVLYHRMNTTNDAIKMPTLARNLIDTNAVTVIKDWINSLPGTPALEPPTLQPAGGTFASSVQIGLQHPTTNVTFRYTLDGALPTTSSLLYTGPFNLTNSALVRAKVFAAGFDDSVATDGNFVIRPPVQLQVLGFTNNVFHLQLSGVAGKDYVFQATTNLVNWMSLSTNVAPANLFQLMDSNAATFPYRFYRAIELP